MCHLYVLFVASLWCRSLDFIMHDMVSLKPIIQQRMTLTNYYMNNMTNTTCWQLMYMSALIVIISPLLLSHSIIVQIHIGRLIICCLNQLYPFYVSHFDYISPTNRLDFRKIARTLLSPFNHRVRILHVCVHRMRLTNRFVASAATACQYLHRN